MKTQGLSYLALAMIGAAWGVTFPISKIVVASGYQPFGILVWQLCGAMIITGTITLARRRRLRLSRQYFGLYLGVAVLGSVLSGYFSYTAAAHLPAGVLAIIIALVPLFAMPIALAMGYETPSWVRGGGLLLGAAAVVVLIAPDTSLPDASKAVFVLVAMLATLAYAVEGNFLEWVRIRAAGQLPDPFQILFGASLVGLGLALPLALVSAQFFSPFRPWGAPEWGILLISLFSTSAYSGYIWLIARTGPVFAAQVAYLVTGFGVVWSMVLLGEAYSGWVWLALMLILAGLFLVQPRLRGSIA